MIRLRTSCLKETYCPAHGYDTFCVTVSCFWGVHPGVQNPLRTKTASAGTGSGDNTKDEAGVDGTAAVIAVGLHVTPAAKAPF